jgi:(p)ppGpp synthase/HD superfamily hydrolase
VVHASPTDTSSLADAERFLDALYRDRLRRAGRGVEHPRAVAALLGAHGQPPAVVLAGLLHDALEDCDVTSAELGARFGPQVAKLVEAVTQDPTIDSYATRKAALRRQTVDAGPAAATIALADKLSKVEGAAAPPPRRKLAHYRATLEEIEARYGADRLSRALHRALDRWPDPRRD